MKTIAVLLLSAVPALAAVGGNCPVLDLKTLPKAACSRGSTPFKENASSSIAYAAITPCPSTIGIRKTFQNIFKGPKLYQGIEVNIRPGLATCRYQLDQRWKTLLNTTSEVLVLNTAIESPDEADYFSKQGYCPILNRGHATQIQKGQLINFTHKNNTNLRLEFKAQPLNPNKNRVQVMMDQNISVSNLDNGMLSIDRGFQHECQYEHNTEGEAQKIRLQGVQIMSQDRNAKVYQPQSQQDNPRVRLPGMR